MKILFTSVGRRVELVQAFHNAAQELKVELCIIGADITPDAPALLFCDKTRIVCKIREPEYIPQLLSICREEAVDCLIPTIDTDLLILAQNKAKFEAIGTKVLISAVDKVQLCRDKNYTADYFRSVGLKSPLPVNTVEKYEQAIQNGKAGFPAFIKPKDGSSSINAYKVENLEDLKLYAEKIEDYIIQPYIGGREYTIDIFCDYVGNPVFITPRERLAVRAGEVLKTRITQDETMIQEMHKLIADFKPCGQITVQLIQDAKTGDNYYIEINPRFGGGAPLSIKAGADSAKAVLEMLQGKALRYVPKAAEDGAVYSRFDQSIQVNQRKKKSEIRCVIFDLDDTLFSEKEYVRSGYREIERKTGVSADALWRAFEEGKPAIDTVLSELGRLQEKELCLQIYRNHQPKIELYPGVKELILLLKEKGCFVGIITDGRPEGQRAKLEALGLHVDKAVITDELGGPAFRKPCDIAFRIMQRAANVDFEEMVYIGDNPTKDFVAPKKLGMQTIWFCNRDGIYNGYTFDGAQVESISGLHEKLLGRI